MVEGWAMQALAVPTMILQRVEPPVREEHPGSTAEDREKNKQMEPYKQKHHTKIRACNNVQYKKFN